jgi:hypothetical protein
MTGWTVFGQQGNIRETTGTVEIKNPGAAAFVAAKPGDPVTADTIISTGFKSGAVIVLGSSTVNVRPLTRLTLAEITSAGNAEQVGLNIQTGRVRVEVKPPAGTKTDFTVRSPTATASVRGTEFFFDTVNLTVSEGTVQYAGRRGRSVPVGAGGSSQIDPVSGRSVDPVAIATASLLPPGPAGLGTGTGSGNLPAFVKSPGPSTPAPSGDSAIDITIGDWQ